MQQKNSYQSEPFMSIIYCIITKSAAFCQVKPPGGSVLRPGRTDFIGNINKNRFCLTPTDVRYSSRTAVEILRNSIILVGIVLKEEKHHHNMCRRDKSFGTPMSLSPRGVALIGPSAHTISFSIQSQGPVCTTILQLPIFSYVKLGLRFLGISNVTIFF